MSRSSCLPASLLLVVAWAAGAQAQLLRERDAAGLDKGKRAEQVFQLLGPEHLLHETWRLTTRRIFDKEALPPDWPEIRERYTSQIRSADRPEDAYAVINEMLGELKISHLVLMKRSVFERQLWSEFLNQPSLRTGCELEAHGSRLFVSLLAEDGPAARAGLRMGDEVVTVGSLPIRESALLEPTGRDPGLDELPAYALRVDEPRPMLLGVRRRAGGDVEQVRLEPRACSLVEAVQASVRVVEHDGVRLGLIHVWHFLHEEVWNIIKGALKDDLAQVDAWVFDLRGRGGYVNLAKKLVQRLRPREGRKPVVGLIDRHTRSAKETLSLRWKEQEIGPLVGERTAGACISIGFSELSDGAVLMVPRSRSAVTWIEGTGVEPTHAVEQLPLPYRGGRDAILAAGLDLAAQAVKR